MVDAAMRRGYGGRGPSPRHPGRPSRRRGSAPSRGVAVAVAVAVTTRPSRPWSVAAGGRSPPVAGAGRHVRRPALIAACWPALSVGRPGRSARGAAPWRPDRRSGRSAAGRRSSPSRSRSGAATRVVARGRGRALRAAGCAGGPARRRVAEWRGGDRVESPASGWRSTRERAARVRLAARRRRARRRLGRRRPRPARRWPAPQPGAGADRAGRRRPAGRPGRAGPGARHRRRPRPAAGDGRALPRQRAVPPHRRVRSERRVRARRRRPAAARGPGRSARWAADGGADRLVRRAHPGRAVACCGPGRWRRSGATAFVLGRQREPVRLLAARRHRPAARRPAARLVGRVLAVGRAPPPASPSSARGWRAGCGVLGPLALPVGVTLGAQVGVALPSLLVFGRLSLVGTVGQPRGRPGRRARDAVRAAGLPARRRRARPSAPVVMAPVGWARALGRRRRHRRRPARAGRRRGRGSAGSCCVALVVAVADGGATPPDGLR